MCPTYSCADEDAAAYLATSADAEHPHSVGNAHGSNLTISPPPPVMFETLDHELLSSLDGILTLLDTQPTGLLLRWLLILKERHEREIPAMFAEAVR